MSDYWHKVQVRFSQIKKDVFSSRLFKYQGHDISTYLRIPNQTPHQHLHMYLTKHLSILYHNISSPVTVPRCILALIKCMFKKYTGYG